MQFYVLRPVLVVTFVIELFVLTTINFYDDLLARATKIYYERSNTVLPIEFDPKFSIAKIVPESFFGVGRPLSQDSSSKLLSFVIKNEFSH